jgi:hypothetical protein
MRDRPGSTFRTGRTFATVAVVLGFVAACTSVSSTPKATTVATAQPTANATQAPTPTPGATPTAAGATKPAASPRPQLTTLADAADHYVTCPDGSPNGCLVPGTYRLGSDVLSTGVSPVVVPAGWFEWDMGPGTEGLLVERSDADDGSGWGALFSSVGLVSRDPCDSSKGMFPAGSTSSADELLAAMKTWPDFQVGAPRSITLGGAAGKQVAVTSSKTAAECPNPVIWRTPQGTDFNGYPEVGAKPKTDAGTFLLLDVVGEVLAIRTTDFPQTTSTELGQGVKPDPTRHLADQQTLHTILDSLRFSQGS